MKPEKQRNPAPEFALKDVDGKTVRLSEYKGKVVVLNFFATWCGPCKIEIPWLMDFENSYKHQGFAVLGISMDEDGWETVRPYIEGRRVNYRVMMGDDTVAQAYGGVDSLPTTFLIDREGRVASVHVGLSGRGDYENEINQLLNTPAPQTSSAGFGVSAFALGANQRFVRSSAGADFGKP